MNKKLLVLTLSSMLLAGCNPATSSSTTSSKVDSSPISENTNKESTSSKKEEERKEHTVIFMADGKEVGKVTYTEGDTSITAPAVPEKEGYVGSWEEYTLGESDIIVEAVYKVDIDVKNGNFDYTDGKYVSSLDNSLAIDPRITMSNGTLSVNMLKGAELDDSGIVFGVTYSDTELENYWEANGVSYYFFFVNRDNNAYLAKVDNGSWIQLGRVEPIYDFNYEMEYPLSVSFDNGTINCFVGDKCLIKYIDSNPLIGTGVGYRSQNIGATYSRLIVTDSIAKDSKDVIDGYTVAHGSASLDGTTVTVKESNTILVNNTISMQEGKVYATNYKAGTRQDSGLVVALKDDGYASFWEESNTNMEYYFFFINRDGILILSKVGSTTAEGVWTTVADNNNIKDFDPSKTYEMAVEIVGSTIKCYIDGMLVLIHDTQKDLTGRKVGLRAQSANTEFSLIEERNSSSSDEIEWYQRSGSYVKDENGALNTSCDGSLAWANNKSLTTGSFSVDITATQASDTGIVFGGSDPVATRWEEKPYYFFFVNGGNIGLLAGPINGWTTIKDVGDVSDKMNPYGQANTFKVEIKDGYNIICSINGHEVINVTISDSALQLTGTYFGVRNANAGQAKFENFVIVNA